MPAPEVWLRGAIVGVPPLLQPVAHALLQCREEIAANVARLEPDQIWSEPNGAASVGYHVRHAAGSLDRLLTYARGAALSDGQLLALEQESRAAAELGASALVGELAAAVERALNQIKATDERTLTEARVVGRAQLPSTVGGLLFHAAEHTQRHTGQIATTVRIIRWP